MTPYPLEKSWEQGETTAENDHRNLYGGANTHPCKPVGFIVTLSLAIGVVEPKRRERTSANLVSNLCSREEGRSILH